MLVYWAVFDRKYRYRPVFGGTKHYLISTDSDFNFYHLLTDKVCFTPILDGIVWYGIYNTAHKYLFQWKNRNKKRTLQNESANKESITICHIRHIHGIVILEYILFSNYLKSSSDLANWNEVHVCSDSKLSGY